MANSLPLYAENCINIEKKIISSGREPAQKKN
jgi:hypothetical protein